MADISYVPPNRNILATDFAALVAAANDKLKLIYNNQPVPLIAMNDTISFGSRRFFFCDTITPADESTIWRYFIAHHTSAPWKRVYDHAPFTDFAAAAVPDDGYPDVSDPDAPAVRVEAPDSGDWATRKAAIWPEGGYPSSSADILQCSLEAHRFTGGDYDNHLIYVRGCDNAEYEHVFHQAEIIIGEGFTSPFEWPENYNKYRLLRFSNLLPTDVVIKLPVVDTDGTFVEWDEVTVYAMSSRCVRRTTDLPQQSWVTGYEYFQLPLPDDPCIINDPDTSALSAPLTVATQVYNARVRVGYDYSLGIPQLRFDQDGLYDQTGLYCGPPSVAQPKAHFPTPEGGWFAALADEGMLGDYTFHRGKLLVVSVASELTVTRTPDQAETMSGTEMTVTLRKADGTIARGVTDLTVSGPGGDIPAGSDPTLNWELENIDPGGPTDHWEITFYVQPGYISDGDDLDIAFKHLADDQRQVFDFKGFGTIADDLDAVGITVTDGPTGHENQLLLSSTTQKDLLGLSTNLILGSFGSPGVEVTDTLPAGGALLPYFPNFGIGALTRYSVAINTDTINASYKTYSVSDASDWSTYAYDHDEDLSVDSRNYSATPNGGTDFKLTDTVTDVFNSLGPGGDFDYGENAFGIAFTFTVFGAAFRYVFSLDMKYPWSKAEFAINHYQAYEGFATITGNGDDEPYTYGIVEYDFLDRSKSAGIRSWPTPDAPLAHYPRSPRISSNIRTNNEPTNVLNQSQPTTERPSTKAYYESKPWKDGVQIPLTTNVMLGGQIKKRFIAILGQVTEALFDAYARLSGWVGFDVIPYKIGGVDGTGSFDASEGSYVQSSYYASDRATLLSPIGTPNANDTAMGHNSPVMSAETFNTLASIINGIKKKNGSDYRNLAQYGSFDNIIGALGRGRGIGTCNYRPREQYASWSSDDTDMTDFITACGIPIKTASDFPDFAPFMTDDVYWYSPPSVTTSPDGSTTTSILDAWGPYHGITSDVVTKYRYITIDDVKAFCDAQGMNFEMEELSIPATFDISTGTPSLVANGDISHPVIGTLRPCMVTAAGWYNDGAGDWVFTPENNVIRSSISQTDRPIIAASNQDGFSNYAIYDPGFSSDLCTRLYYNGAIPTNAAAAQVANHTFLYRRYGCQGAKAVVWPRNYNRVETDFSSDSTNATARIVLNAGALEYNPMTQRSSLESDGPEITDMSADENTITTSHENGEIFIIHTGTALE